MHPISARPSPFLCSVHLPDGIGIVGKFIDPIKCNIISKITPGIDDLLRRFSCDGGLAKFIAQEVS